MQRCALACGDDERRRAGAFGMRNVDIAVGAERRGDAVDGRDGLRGLALEIAAGDRDAQAGDAFVQVRHGRFGRAIGADGVVGVETLHSVVSQRQIAHGARKRPDMIEARHERECPRAAEPPIGRLEPENAAQRRRHPDRTVGVRAERQRHQAAADGGARAARRTAGHAVEIVRIARRAVVDVLAGEVVGVFAHVERADQDGAGRLQPLDQRRIALSRRPIAVDFGAGECRQAGHVEQVLDRERHAGQRRKLLALRPCRIERLRAGKRAPRGDGGEGIEQRVALADARQRRFDDKCRADAAGGDGSSDRGRRIPGKIAGRGLKHGKPAPARLRPAARIRRPAPRGAGSNPG